MNILDSILQYTYTSFIPEEVPKDLSLRTKHLNKQSKQQRNLPINFADQVMQLQIKIYSYGEYTFQNIKRLNQLYTMAIQHYNKAQSLNQRKREHFINKIKTLLNNRYVMKIMEQKTKQELNQQEPGRQVTDQQIEKQKEEKKVEQKKDLHVKRMKIVDPMTYEANLRHQLDKFCFQQNQVVSKMIESTRKKEDKTKEIIMNNLKNQEDQLKQRILKRMEKKLGDFAFGNEQ